MVAMTALDNAGMAAAMAAVTVSTIVLVISSIISKNKNVSSFNPNNVRY